MIDIYRENLNIILQYTYKYPNANWVYEKLKDDGSIYLKHLFELTEEHLIPQKNNQDDNFDVKFLISTLDNHYFRVDKDILGLSHDVFIYESVPINKKIFIHNKISVMHKIGSLLDEEIIIGGDRSNSIPIINFHNIIESFPTKTELMHYENSRITRVLNDYFQTVDNSQEKLEKHLKRKENLISNKAEPLSTIILKEYEHEKYQFLYDELTDMLKTGGYLEGPWQDKILEMILLIYPQYVQTLANVNVKDYYSDPMKTTNRYLDITLVKASGYIDIIEIKQPFDNSVINSRAYRGNYAPHKELSGAIMQIEKYLFYLSKWGHTGEVALNSKYSKVLLPGISLKIANPKGIIILGRDTDFNENQKLDFEIIKRKYANIVDILTYDDLLFRLKSLISKFTT